MIFLYISIFLFGVISTGIAIKSCKVYIARRDRRRAEKKRIIRSEKDGWIKSDHDFNYWTDRKRMEKWQKSIKDDLELSIWIHENIKGHFSVEYVYGIRYIKFAEEEDAVAFKLRWV